MSNVALTIGGRSYMVACDEGQEEHIVGLGRMIDAKVASMGENASQNEARMLLFAALLIADELHETRVGGTKGGATGDATDGATADAAIDEATSRALETIADRLENLAQRLEDETLNA